MGKKEEPLRLRGGAGDYEIYSPGGTAYTIEGKHGGITEFVSSAAHRDRPPEHTLITDDIYHLNQGGRQSAKEWTLEKPDDSTRIQLQHTDGRVVDVPPTRSGMTRFYKTVGMTRFDYRALKDGTRQEARGWRIYKPEQGQSSSGRGEVSREGRQDRQVYGEPPDWKIVTKSRDGVSGLGKELCLGLTNEGLRGGSPREAFKEGTDIAKIARELHWSEEQKEKYTEYNKKQSYGELVGLLPEDRQKIPGYKEYKIRDNLSSYRRSHDCPIEEAIRVYKKNLEKGESSQPARSASQQGQTEGRLERSDSTESLETRYVRDWTRR